MSTQALSYISTQHVPIIVAAIWLKNGFGYSLNNINELTWDFITFSAFSANFFTQLFTFLMVLDS